MIEFEAVPGGTRFRVRAQPRASRTALVGEHGDALRVRLAAPPVDGAANDELTRFLAKRLRIAPSRVAVIAGAGGRDKLVRVEGVEPDAVRAALLPP
jgi:hypothetical protein